MHLSVSWSTLSRSSTEEEFTSKLRLLVEFISCGHRSKGLGLPAGCGPSTHRGCLPFLEIPSVLCHLGLTDVASYYTGPQEEAWLSLLAGQLREMTYHHLCHILLVRSKSLILLTLRGVNANSQGLWGPPRCLPATVCQQILVVLPLEPIPHLTISHLFCCRHHEKVKLNLWKCPFHCSTGYY